MFFLCTWDRVIQNQVYPTLHLLECGFATAISSFLLQSRSTQDHRHILTKLYTHKQKKKEKLYSPPSADNYTHPHINTHAKKIETHKREGLEFIQVLKLRGMTENITLSCTRLSWSNVYISWLISPGNEHHY